MLSSIIQQDNKHETISKEEEEHTLITSDLNHHSKDDQIASPQEKQKSISIPKDISTTANSSTSGVWNLFGFGKSSVGSSESPSLPPPPKEETNDDDNDNKKHDNGNEVTQKETPTADDIAVPTFSLHDTKKDKVDNSITKEDAVDKDDNDDVDTTDLPSKKHEINFLGDNDDDENDY
eukprot:5184526-Ditylum_brightwellii.AAC.1